MVSATVAGSGTALMSRLQLFNMLTSPPEKSPKYSVHVPFGFIPSYSPNGLPLFWRLAPSNVTPDDNGLMARPSGE